MNQGSHGFSAAQEWKKHWTVVLAAAAGTSISSIPTYAIGLFINPLQDAFGWARMGISSAVTIYAVVGALGAALGGYMLDRVGARQMGIYSVAAFCLIFCALALVTHSIWTWWMVWLLLGIAGFGMKPVVWAKAVSSFFALGRGKAIAVMLCGTALGASVLPFLTNALMVNYGWRSAFVGIGLCFGAVVVPILYLFLYDATDKVEPTHKAAATESLPGWTFREGIRKPALYQIAFSSFIITSIVVGFAVHIVPMLIAQGIPRATAVSLLSVVGILSIVARLGIGHIFDHIQHPAVGALSLASPVLPALILLFVPPSFMSALLTVIMLGICVGGEFDAVIYVSSRFFGLRAFGALFGIVETALLAGVGLGPVIAGAVFDATGSYDAFIVGAIPASLLCGLLIFLLGRFPDHAAQANVALKS